MASRMEYKLPEVLKGLMKKKRLTYRALSCRLDCSEETIARWLTGAGNPSVYSLMSLSNLFGVSIDYLVYGEDSKGAAG